MKVDIQIIYWFEKNVFVSGQMKVLLGLLLQFCKSDEANKNFIMWLYNLSAILINIFVRIINLYMALWALSLSDLALELFIRYSRGLSHYSFHIYGLLQYLSCRLCGPIPKGTALRHFAVTANMTLHFVYSSRMPV